MNLMPLRRRLEIASRMTGLRLDVIQQDYILSWVLFGIYEHPKLRSHLIFKGGTALKKAYFGEYRFSEDLDFSVSSDSAAPIDFINEVTGACQTAEMGMNMYAPIRLTVERYLENANSGLDHREKTAPFRF